MRRPRGAKFTDEQEAELSRTEELMTRARIIEKGVSAFLNTGEYANANEIGIAAEMLTESVALRIDCETKRAAIREAERKTNRTPEAKTQ